MDCAEPAQSEAAKEDLVHPHRSRAKPFAGMPPAIPTGGLLRAELPGKSARSIEARAPPFRNESSIRRQISCAAPTRFEERKSNRPWLTLFQHGSYQAK